MARPSCKHKGAAQVHMWRFRAAQRGLRRVVWARDVRSPVRTVAARARMRERHPFTPRSERLMVPCMLERYPVIRGAEPWSAVGHGARATIGLLLVHGFTGNPVSMRPLGEALASTGFTVDVIRLPGHGTHWRDMRETRYADWRREVVRALEDLRKRCSRVVLVGLSMGGTLVLDVACSHPSQVAGVVPINPALLNREGLVAKLAPYLARVFPVIPARAAGLTENDIAKPGQSEQAYDKVPAAAGNSLMAELPRLRQEVKSLKLPVLVAHSAQDHSVDPENSRELLRILSPQNATELLLERSYHVATLDYDFELLVERIAAFADRVGTASTTSSTA
jgi:carboxylesterase